MARPHYLNSEALRVFHWCLMMDTYIWSEAQKVQIVLISSKMELLLEPHELSALL